MHIFSIEYPDYLQSYESVPNSNVVEQIHRSALAFYDYLLEMGVQQNEIVIIGRSLGTSFASYLAQ